MVFRGDDIGAWIRRRREVLALIALLAIALALRVYQFDWDQGHLYHPDERFILMSSAAISLNWPLDLRMLLSPQSSLIPRDYSYSYGTLSLYVVRIAQALLVELNHFIPSLHFLDEVNDLGFMRVVGRPISALFDTATVYLVYRLGRLFYGKRVAFLAAAFVAFSVIDLQLSHFYATDTIMTALVIASIASSATYLKTGRTSWALWAGVFAGLALATKASAATVLAPVVAAHLLRLFFYDDGQAGSRLKPVTSAEFSRAAGVGFVSLLAGFLAFVIAEPFALIDFHRYITGVFEQSSMVRGVADLPYTRQYFGRPAYLYFLQNLVMFGAGVPLGISMIVGFFYIAFRNVRRPRVGDLLLLSYVIPYFAITGDFWAKFLRYMLPISPLLALFAALFLIRVIDLARGWRAGAVAASEFVEDSEIASPRLPPELVVESYADRIDEADLYALDGDLAGVVDQPVESAIAVESQSAPLHSIAIARVDDSVVRTLAPNEIVLPPNGNHESAEAFSAELAWDWEDLSPPGRAGTQDDPSAPPELPAWLLETKVGEWLIGPWPTRVARGLVAAVLAFTAFYGVAFVNMYGSTTPPVEASQWLYANAAKGSVIATEHWEEGMPVPIAGATGVEASETHNFRTVTMPMYEDDNATKLKTIVDNLAASDYIVFFSNRLYGTVTRIPDRYPMSQRYYTQLFGEQLGFQLVESSARYPNLLGVAFVDDTFADPGLPTPQLLQQTRPAPITINLGHADESFSVYDHQKVLIFRKTQRLTPDQLRALIGPPASPENRSSSIQTPVYKSLLFTPSQEAIVQAGGTFHDLFDRTNIENRLPLLTWIVLIALVGFAGVPLGFYIFRFLPDRGYLVAKTLGVLVLVWLSWMAVSLGIVQATRAEAIGILVLFIALGAAAGHRQRDEILAFWRAHRGLILFEEGLFWVAFLFDVLVRSLDPDLWHPALGGEKPMDLAYFTAAARSATYPPYDPWFAGGYLNYYYFGQVIVGTLTRISGVLPTTSYNLVVPLLFALTVVGAFTAALALLHRANRHPRPIELAGAVLASLMVCVFGNIGGFFQLVTGIVQQSPPDASARLPVIGPVVGLLSSVGGILLGKHPLNIPPDWFWSSTRALALLDIKGGTGSINEFPYFTFLFADLHAHLIALPFTLLAIALAVNVVKSALPKAAEQPVSVTAAPSTTYAQDDLGQVRWGLGTRIVTLVTMGLVVGSLYPTNSWDYPTYLGLFGVALAIPWYLSDRRSARSFLGVLVQFVIVAALSQLLFRPFSSNFQSFYSGVHLSDEKSEIRWYFVINGLFIVIMLAYFGVEAWQRFRRVGLLRLIRLYVGKWELLPRTLQLQHALVRNRGNDAVTMAAYGVIGILAVAGLCVATGMSLVGALLILLIAALALALRRDQSAEECLMVFLFATGLAISIGTEIVAIDGDVGRMNTIFKFYEQIWVLFGVAGAVAVVRLKDRLGSIGSPGVRGGVSAMLIVFFVMAAVYPLVATGARVSQRFFTDIPPTLDGTAYMDRAIYADSDEATRRSAQLHFATDKAMIQWIQDNVTGTPTILEGNRPLYRWGSRISIYTGLPTVIGWDWHQKQQRSGYQNQVDERLADVRRMYDDPSPDTTISLLRKYDVTYIIDGELEVGFYPTARTKFDSMVGQYLTVAYDQSGARIYQVK